jgi:hypothetical protein
LDEFVPRREKLPHFMVIHENFHPFGTGHDFFLCTE